MIGWLVGSALVAAFKSNPLGFLLLNLGKDLRAVWKWLCHRSFWQLTTLAAGIYIGVQYFELRHARSDEARAITQRDDAVKHAKTLQTTLDAISSKKNEQQIVTRERLKVVTRTIHEKELIAQKIEQAPDEPQCRTPTAILQADL